MSMAEVTRKTVLLLAVFVPVAAWSQSSTMPLGDLVKQSKPTRKAARVVTNDDLPAHPPEPSAAVAAADTPGEQGAARDKEKVRPKNPVLAQRLADLQQAEDAEEQLIAEVEKKLNDDSEPVSPQQRRSWRRVSTR